ncbi:MAG: ABC transporter ATP-binding protein [Bacteroidota bacterium]
MNGDDAAQPGDNADAEGTDVEGPATYDPRPATLLTARGLTKSYPTAKGPLTVLGGVDLDVRRGEFVAIVGESGTGKSTLLHLLGALDRPTSGRVSYTDRTGRETDVFAYVDEALASFRGREIGFVFQFHHLLPEFSALENVAMPALIQRTPTAQAHERAASLLASMGLADRTDHRPAQLSGGERQRVAIARALMNQPGLVLADEPTGNLDTKTADALHNELRALSREQGQAFVIVTHNPALAALADRVLTLEDGRLSDGGASYADNALDERA